MRQLRPPNIAIEELHRRQRPSKGVGHLDSIGDAIMEQVSVALCREYRAIFGRILHHVDPAQHRGSQFVDRFVPNVNPYFAHHVAGLREVYVWLCSQMASPSTSRWSPRRS